MGGLTLLATLEFVFTLLVWGFVFTLSIFFFEKFRILVYCINMGVTIVGNTATFSGTGTLTREVVKTVNLNTNGITEVIITGYTSIGDFAFSLTDSNFNYEMPTSFTSVTISASVTTIGFFAFYSCEALANVSIPANSQLTSIGDNAFNSCYGLTSFYIPDSVTTIGRGAFNSCRGLTSILLPASVTTISYAAFEECRGLTSFSIPAGVTSIGESAFEECDGLTSFTIPADSQLTSIGESAFEGCDGLTSFEIPASVTTIENSAFEDCDGLTSFSIPASVTTIENSAFYGCNGLTSISIANNSQLTSIGNYAFYICPALQTVYIQDGLLGIESPGRGYFFGSPSQVNFLLPLPGTPTITGFSIPSKTYGEVPFTVTPPDSNNTTVGFTYTSDNLSVATIDGSTGEIIIGGPGQATITATQAATANYLSGTIDTTFTVNQSTQTNPTNIGSAAALEYFLNSTTAKYGNIASTLQISTNLQSLMSYKKLFTTQNNVKIAHA